MNVVLYLRYSDSKQRIESIEGQRMVCTQYAEKEGHIIVGEYVDKALTGRNDDRPNFLRMIKDSKKKYFQGVLVYQYDRFSRNKYDSAIYKQQLKKNGVKVLSAKESISDGPDGILLESVLEGLSEYYSAELSEKVNRGMLVNAEKCLSNGGTTPFGYKIVDRHYVIDEKAAPIVREIFERYASGWSAKQICDNLNERGIRTGTGAKFNRSSLHVMLKNEKYLGIYIFKDIRIPGGMPKIVDEELFKRVAEVMESNKLAPARSRAKAEYILTGKLYCGYCKEKMVGHSSKQISKKGVIFNYYKCKNSGGDRPCKKKMVQKDYIETIIVNECKKLLSKDNIRRIAHEIMRIVLAMEDDTEVLKINAEIEKAEEEKDNHMTSLRSCKNDSVREMIFEDLEKIAANLKNLNARLEKEKAKRYIVSEKEVIEYLSSLANGNINDKQYRKSLIKLFVNKIFLYDDRFTITFNSGDQEVTITDKILSDIEKEVFENDLCISKNVVHHK